MSITPEELRVKFEALKEASQARHERAMAELDEQLQRITQRHNEFTEDLWSDNAEKVATFSQMAGVHAHV